jgi:hypothetical protein
MKFKSAAQRKAVMAKFKYGKHDLVYIYPEQASVTPFVVTGMKQFRPGHGGKPYNVYEVKSHVEEKDLNVEGN